MRGGRERMVGFVRQTQAMWGGVKDVLESPLKDGSRGNSPPWLSSVASPPCHTSPHPLPLSWREAFCTAPGRQSREGC